ncbi:hypothetical protein AN958_10829 [Leucoagaricus sp. SymC.cos]|nr:hypothetical protein AN958_10829 [Leucoagaricus sp. SymC.cos]
MQAEKDLESSLDMLKVMGVLQKINCMSLEALLNPKDKSSAISDSDDINLEIFNAVTKHQKAVASGTNPEDDSTDGADAIESAIPSHKEFIEAQATINHYVTHVNHNSQLRQQLEHALKAYAREVHKAQFMGLKDTKVTNYFTK